jgi:hypothetical protein
VNKQVADELAISEVNLKIIAEAPWERWARQIRSEALAASSNDRERREHKIDKYNL